MLSVVLVLILCACGSDVGNSGNATNKTSIKCVRIVSIEDQVYTGQEIKPTQELKDGSKILVEGEDYIYSYSNNINIGTATLTITGVGDYEGSVNIRFKIVESKKITTNIVLKWGPFLLLQWVA